MSTQPKPSPSKPATSASTPVPKKIKTGSRAGTSPSGKAAPDKTPTHKAKAQPSIQEPAPKAPAPASRPIAKNTKQAQLVALLQRKSGASLVQISTRFGWQAHTTRAALSGLRKRGLVIERTARPGKTSCYFIRQGEGA